MPEWTEVTDPKRLKPGAVLRAYKGDFNRVESVVKEDEEGDIFAPLIGFLTNTYTGTGDWQENWDRIEVKTVLPTDPGFYMSYKNSVIVELKRDGRWIIDNTVYPEQAILVRRAPLTRVFTEEEVDKIVAQALDLEEAEEPG